MLFFRPPMCSFFGDFSHGRVLFAKGLMLVVFMSALWLSGCTKTQTPPAEPVAASADDQGKAQAASVQPAGDPTLPPELQNVDKLDPASTLPVEDIKGSDFYEVKQQVEAQRQAMDAEWKAQEQEEESVRKAKDDEKARLQEEQKKEEQKKEEVRQRMIKNHEALAKERLRDERRAKSEVRKMPTISRDDVMWNGLE